MMKMDEVSVSPDFTIDDIHKIREWNYARTKDMSVSKKNAYYSKGAEKFKELIRSNADSENYCNVQWHKGV